MNAMKSPSETVAGLQAAARGLNLLTKIEAHLAHQLELMRSPTKSWLTAGSVAYGGTIGTTALQLIGPNLRRRGLSVQNTGTTGNLTLGLGSTSPVSGSGLVLLPGTSWDGRISGAVWEGSVSIIGSQSGVTYAALNVPGPRAAT